MDEQNQKSILNKFSEYLEQKLTRSLPGLDAHLQMSPMVNGMPFRGFKAREDAKSSAVLLLVQADGSEIKLLFTLRSSNLNSHSGQISFPGGRIETGESYIDAALRETYEEINVEPSAISVIGSLSTLFVPPSNSIIYPVIGFAETETLDIIPNPDEVDEVFSVPISDFYKQELKTIENWRMRDTDVEVPVWKIHDTTPLWGATAMILSEFLFISNEFINKYEHNSIVRQAD